MLSVSENGYGKRSEFGEFATKGRGNKGMIFMQTSERNGDIVGAVQVFDGDELMMISDQGTMVRTRIDEISVLGRNTQGVRVIRLKEGEHVVGVERIEEPAPETLMAETDTDTEASTDTDNDADTGTDTSAENSTDADPQED